MPQDAHQFGSLTIRIDCLDACIQYVAASESNPHSTTIYNTQLNLPGLQRVASRACIVCGAAADMYCSRCSVTPYCSTECQRRDWGARHSAVCHNLMRLHATGGKASPIEQPDDNMNVEVPPPPAPLRRPRSPVSNRGQPQRDRGQPANFKTKVTGEQRPQTTHCNNNNKTRFVPPDHHPPPLRSPRNAKPDQESQRRRDQGNTNDGDDEEWTVVPEKTPEHKPTPKPKIDSTTPKPKINLIPSSVEAKIEQPKKPASVKSDNFKLNSRMGANLSPDNQMTQALVPPQYLIEKLPIGESFVLSVEQPAQSCATKQQGFVCIAIHQDYQEQYSILLGEIYDGDRTIQPQPGSTFAYLDPSDESWYRARCLSSARCALLDASRIAEITAKEQCRALAPSVAGIPEFCCVLNGNVEVSMSLKCTILMKTADGYKVSIDAYTEDSYLGEGIITRWLPEVEQSSASQPPEEPQPQKIQRQPPKTPAPVETRTKTPVQERPTTKTPIQEPTKIAQKPATPIQEKPSTKSVQAQIPSVPRPPIVNNARYILLHVTSLSRACVRACDAQSTAEFESVLQDVALYGVQNGKRLTEPPAPGQLVLCHYEGVHYRALVKRTKATDNRYKVEYIEYGNEEIVPLEKLFSCPSTLDLTSRPARASIIQLSTISTVELTPPATEYIEGLKEEVEMIATTPAGENTVPSGSLVHLSLARNKESVNKKLEAMCTPDWKKLEDNGGDVMESEVMLFTDMKTLPLPTSRPFILEVTDFSNVEAGVVCGFELGAKEADYVFGPLTQRINEYCKSELCSDPYLPMVEEICLARLPPYPQWFRAVIVEHRPGASTAAVLYTDYGNVEPEVPVTDLRKCMPEFATHPAVAVTADIKDWPKPATKEQIVRALEYLNINEDGRGQLSVKRCKRIEDDLTYIIEAPELIAAVNAL